MSLKHALLSALLIVSACPAITIAADQPQVIMVSGTGKSVSNPTKWC